VNTNDATKPVMSVLIGTDEQVGGEAVRIMVADSFGNERELHCTVKSSNRAIRKAASLYDFEVVILLVNTMRPDRGADRFEQTLEVIRELRRTTRATVIVGTSFHPTGFLTRAEQAGADGLIEVPFTTATIKETIQNAFEGRKLKAWAAAEAAKAKRKREQMRLRVVLLDDCPVVLEMLSGVIRSCWERATIVSCTDSHAAWEELQQTTPDLFVTDLVHGGIDGCQMLARLAELDVKYPIVVLSGNLPKREAEARAAAGTGLNMSYWQKPIVHDEFIDGIMALMESGVC